MRAGMVIVGAGECGARAALALREQGYEGPVTLVGEEPHHPYERPPLSKDMLAADAAPAPRFVSAPDAWVDKHIVAHVGRKAVAIDPAAHRVRLDDGSDLPYDRLLLATGASPRPLPLAAPAGERTATLRTYADALAIRDHLSAGKHLAIVGGGFIGLELAASARRRGADVTLIEAQPRILMRGVPEEIAAAVARRHRMAGVTLLCGQGIASFDRRGDGVRISLADGEVIDADLAVIGIGSIPATVLAAEAGLAIENGIAVDEQLRTSAPDIFAAGDCCSFPLDLYGGRRVRLESWRNAQEQGALAARNMLGAGEAVSAVPWFWSDQYELSLQVAGLADGAVATARRELGDGAFLLFHLGSDGRLLAASGIGPGNAVARDIRLAEMLIGRRAKVDAAQLASPTVKLKALLAA